MTSSTVPHAARLVLELVLKPFLIALYKVMEAFGRSSMTTGRNIKVQYVRLHEQQVFSVLATYSSHGSKINLSMLLPSLPGRLTFVCYGSSLSNSQGRMLDVNSAKAQC